MKDLVEDLNIEELWEKDLRIRYPETCEKTQE